MKLTLNHFHKGMRMRRISLISLSGVFILMTILSACTFTTQSSVDNQTATAEAAAQESIQSAALSTPTILPTETPTPTPTSTLDPYLILTITPSIPGVYLTPIVNRPAVYVLQPGEFPYCIARRFDVHPRELLDLNNLRSGVIYQPGLTLSIPQTGRPFPPPRALRAHPTSFTVQESQMTVFKVACLFGEVDPAVIMQVNGLTSTVLSFGTTLQIP
ncbi:MAG: hypothetical protein JETCAE02_04400 [Anaerolineaceae bacterium]|nr:LysM peptidoglycan-binding domain-containing protein [Anaerolineae bacterium]MBL1172576.1 LysM peptidoglycan-binding domain-containing protein [Chloroflexota bacterium]MDL1926535.1 LysM peptidoglycan-binding domain-containing protein [Anaerolineae bacterium AMX1]GIK10960.1 MAG: hypothetical protein BroJett001_30260 [Chloroflexota bacterium]GJQ38028.1 MAG: hypothetical protein JETCAE02_04400 [Anaerolineaceae bacterium]